MSKELEALDRLGAVADTSKYWNSDYFVQDFNIVKQALQRLETIDNAKPSEALEDLEKMANQVFQVDDKFDLYYNKVKQYILKSQEQEKVLSIIKEKRVIIDLLIDNNLEDYNNKIIIIYGYALSTGRQLIQEEFELLKRWLG